MNWLYVWGGIVMLLWGLWLFTEFAIGAAIDWLRERIKHD
jgi:hypothetical protein